MLRTPEGDTTIPASLNALATVNCPHSGLVFANRSTACASCVGSLLIDGLAISQNIPLASAVISLLSHTCSKGIVTKRRKAKTKKYQGWHPFGYGPLAGEMSHTAIGILGISSIQTPDLLVLLASGRVLLGPAMVVVERSQKPTNAGRLMRRRDLLREDSFSGPPVRVPRSQGQSHQIVFWEGTGLCPYQAARTRRLPVAADVEPGGTLMLSSAQRLMLTSSTGARKSGNGDRLWRDHRCG